MFYIRLISFVNYDLIKLKIVITKYPNNFKSYKKKSIYSDSYWKRLKLQQRTTLKKLQWSDSTLEGSVSIVLIT